MPEHRLPELEVLRAFLLLGGASNATWLQNVGSRNEPQQRNNAALPLCWFTRDTKKKGRSTSNA
eukprot:2741829-Lingulodinium_polyedra.AAC.1